MNYKNINIDWLGHDSFKIKTNSSIIYIDPFKISDNEKANIILITHPHYDHCSPEDIEKISDKETIIVSHIDCQSKLTHLKIKGITYMIPNQKIKANNIIIESLPSYNINKPFHLKENEWLGFIIDLNGTRIYHAGDTDFIPEMQNVKNIDIALLPISGTYVMNVEEALKAVSIIKPDISIPMHYGKIIGNLQDAEKFKNLCPSKVIILEKC